MPRPEKLALSLALLSLPLACGDDTITGRIEPIDGPPVLRPDELPPGGAPEEGEGSGGDFEEGGGAGGSGSAKDPAGPLDPTDPDEPGTTTRHPGGPGGAAGGEGGEDGASGDSGSGSSPCDAEGAPEDCCTSDLDCEDGDTLTLDVCEGATCVATPNPDACAGAAACDDGDPCTTDSCTSGLCAHAGGSGSLCCAADSETPLADFDQGTQDGLYVTDNLETGFFWTADKTRSTTGKWSLYCGDPKTQTYAAGARVKSSATTPPFTVPSGGQTSLRLDVFKSTREILDLDVLQVFVLRDGALLPAWTSKSLPAGQTSGFEPVDVPLASHAGETIQLRIVFDSVDGAAPAFEGVYVDSLRLVTSCE